MEPTGGEGRAYLDRLQLAVDVRLVDNVHRWPELARQATQIVERIAQTAKTRRRVFDELSQEERLLHAVAQALGGQLDDREARTIHDLTSDTDRDVPFVAIVLASRGFDTERARSVYLLALDDKLGPALEDSLRMAFERGFPPARADRLPARVRDKLLARWPDTPWSRIVRALGGSDRDLAILANDQPQLLAGGGARVVDALVANARWRTLLARLDSGSIDDQRARLGMLASAVAWRFPLPAAAIGAGLARTGMHADPQGLLLALATGDSTGAAQLARSAPDLLGEPEAACARGLAFLGGTPDEVQRLGLATPHLGPRPASARASGSWAIAAATSTIHAALFALELGDRHALRELAAPLGAHRETIWGRILLARVYLGMGEPSLVEPLLFRDDGPVAALLRARALAATDLPTAMAWLRDLCLEHPGWSEARLRYGLALARSDAARAIAILEEAPDPSPDSAVLGPPATARAAAQLAAAELARRRTGTDVAMRIRVAMALAPASPLVARQATTLAVAIRDSALAMEAHARLQGLAPHARVVERLAAGILELRGEVDRALDKYRAAGAWDRVVVLAARARREVELPELSALTESASVAALHAVAVVANQRGDKQLAAQALERAVARRPDHAGLAADFVAMRTAVAREALVEGDLADQFYAARELERAMALVDDPQLRAAFANLVLATCARWTRVGELERARVRIDELFAKLDPKRDAQTRQLVMLHHAALALREGNVVDARHAIESLPESDHVRLLRTLVAVVAGNFESLETMLPMLVEARTPAVASAGELLDRALRRTAKELAKWAFDPASRANALGPEAALYLAYLLAEEPDADATRPQIAALLERAAARVPSSDLDGRRRLELAALGFRATATPPEAIDIDAIDLGQLEHGDERELAIGLVALEVKRLRKATKPDRAAANKALSRLVALVRPSGSGDPISAAVLALTSIDDAADAAIAEWRSEPDDVAALQAALSTQLRRAIGRELGGAPDGDCLAAWHTVVGLLAPVLVSIDPWHALADSRNEVYEVPYLDIPNARTACQRRIEDILAALGRWHAARGGEVARAATRLDEVRHLLATEVSIVRTVETIIAEHDWLTEDAFPIAVGPIGLDLLGRRTRAVEALGEVEGSDETATMAADIRGILAGALLDGWIALHDGRLDVAEQIARDRIASTGRPDSDATRLLGALYVRRIREALDENDINGAGEIAGEWVTRENRVTELPAELAAEIANLCRAIFDRYGMNPARRKLQQIRNRHDDRTLREVEAELILRYLDRGRASEPLDRTKLLLEVMALAPTDAVRVRLHEQLQLALAAMKELEAVDDMLRQLVAGDAPKLADCIVSTQVRKSELGDRRLRSSAALEARVEELRRVLDLGRSVGTPVGRVLDRLVFLHERLHQIFTTAGNHTEAQRHQRRAAAYRNWNATEDTPA